MLLWHVTSGSCNSEAWDAAPDDVPVSEASCSKIVLLRAERKRDGGTAGGRSACIC